jgi:tetratricopeptide (TPR) repeat protein
MMLARLLELAASDSLVMVVSDHGVISHEMPRPGGLLVAAGPRVRADERIYGASLLDVAPTILAFSGLPIPADIEGRTLLEIFDGTIEVERRGAVSRSSRDAVEPFEDIEVELPEAAKLLRYNHARSLLGAERAEDAACVLEELRRDYSDDEHLVLLHAQALYAQGQFDACRALLQRFEPSQRPPMAEVLLGFLAFRDGRPEETLERLARAEASGSRLPRLHHEIGSAYLQLRRWDDAARSFRCALAIDGGSARTRDGLASALLALGRPEEALEEALRAVRLSHGLASAHFHLGVALAGTGERERAIQALETSVALDGNASDARLLLHRLREDEAAQVRARNA